MCVYMSAHVLVYACVCACICMCVCASIYVCVCAWMKVTDSWQISSGSYTIILCCFLCAICSFALWLCPCNKTKVQFTLEQTLLAQRGSTDIVELYFILISMPGGSGQSVACPGH